MSATLRLPISVPRPDESNALRPTQTVEPALTSSRSRAILAVILTSYFMIVLDNSIVFTGLPRIRAELDFTAAGLSWVHTAYALTFGGLLLLAARAGDLLGRRRVFLVGLTIFSLSSLAIGLAPTGEFMIAARAVQGVGSAILAPTSLALLTANFAVGPARTKAVAAYGSTAGIGASVGLVAGGLIAELTSWRVGFLVNVPIGILLAIGTIMLIRETDRSRGRFDVFGAITSTVGMVALIFGITHTADHGWGDPIALGSLAAGVVVLVGFVFIEMNVSQPILPLSLFRDGVRTGAFGARFLFSGAMFGFFFFISQYLQSVLGMNPFETGMAFLPMTVVQFASSLFVPKLIAKYGLGPLLLIGLLIAAGGMGWLGFIGADSTYWVAVAPPMILLGLGQGIAFGPLTGAGIHGVPPQNAGAASGLVNVAHQIGGAFGVSIITVITVAAGAEGDMSIEAPRALVTAAIMLGIAVSLIAIAVMPALRRETRSAR